MTKRLSFLLGVLIFLVIAATTDQIIRRVYDSTNSALRVIGFDGGGLGGIEVASGSGTANVLMKFNAAGEAADSRLTDTGSGAITSTAALALPSGTAAAPALIKATTPTTGWHWSGSGQNAFVMGVSGQTTGLQLEVTSGVTVGATDRYRFSSSESIFSAVDVELARIGPAEAKVTNGGAGYGTLDALALKMSGTKVVGQQGAAVADPSGGTVQDVQCRAQLSALLARLRDHGLIAP